MYWNKTMQVGLVDKVLKQEGYHPTYNTVHLYNPTSLWALSYAECQMLHVKYFLAIIVRV